MSTFALDCPWLRLLPPAEPVRVGPPRAPELVCPACDHSHPDPHHVAAVLDEELVAGPVEVLCPRCGWANLVESWVGLAAV